MKRLFCAQYEQSAFGEIRGFGGKAAVAARLGDIALSDQFEQARMPRLDSNLTGLGHKGLGHLGLSERTVCHGIAADLAQPRRKMMLNI